MTKIQLSGGLNDPVESTGAAPKVKSKAKEIKIPAAHKPGVDWDGHEVEITSEPSDSPEPDWNAVLKSWGYDSNTYEIVEPVKVSCWDAQGPEGEVIKLWSYKAGVRTKSFTRDADYKTLRDEIKRHKKPKTVAPTGDLTFVVNIADTQCGKSDGDGTVGTIQRLLDLKYHIETRYNELRKIGRNLGTLVVAGVGDLIENCDGHYASQTFSVELNRREQVRVLRRIIRDLIAYWAKDFEKVIVLAVPGNHGENRLNGKAFTTLGDNDDVAIFEMIAEIFAANPEVYGHVEFYIPEDDHCVVMDFGNIRVGWTHGHIAGGSGNPQAKIRSWWNDQLFGGLDIGTCDILITGHYHHFSIVEYGPKVHIQCPALESESTWFKNLKGANSRPGVLTFVLNDSGYQDIEIIGGN